MFKKLDLNEKEKKKLITLLSLGLVCLISLVLINFLQNRNNTNQQSVNTEVQDNEQLETKETESEREDLESRLTDILKEINGSGDVSVMITYDNSEEIEPAYNSNSTKEISLKPEQLLHTHCTASHSQALQPVISMTTTMLTDSSPSSVFH